MKPEQGMYAQASRDESSAPRADHHANLSLRAAGSLSIARMAEPQALAPRDLEGRGLIHREMQAQESANAFRELRTRLLALAGHGNFITMVAPISNDSGGSFVARNLAAAFAFDEAKTALLIDCDLRRPRQHRDLGIEGAGLIDYLEEPAIGVEKIIHPTGVPRLRLIPAGKPREMSGEYFSSYRMRAVIDMLRSRYPDRYIILDAPPVKGSPDARILSDLADVVVLVTGYGRDTVTTIEQAAAGFDPAKLAGVVFNEGI